MKLVNDKVLIDRFFVQYNNGCEPFFPIIGCVLQGKQKGLVYVDSFDSPQVLLVIHNFGFAQVITAHSTSAVWEMVCHTIHSIAQNSDDGSYKIRFYNAGKGFIDYVERQKNYHYQVGERIRGIYYKNQQYQQQPVYQLTAEDVDLINNQHDLDISGRFWSSQNDFFEYGHTYCVKEGDVIKSLCYAAALCENKAEMDMSTHKEHRRSGHAKEVMIGFIKNAIKAGIVPMTDLYANNNGSLKTIESIERTEKTVVHKEIFRYQFLIINIGGHGEN